MNQTRQCLVVIQNVIWLSLIDQDCPKRHVIIHNSSPVQHASRLLPPICKPPSWSGLLEALYRPEGHITKPTNACLGLSVIQQTAGRNSPPLSSADHLTCRLFRYRSCRLAKYHNATPKVILPKTCINIECIGRRKSRTGDERPPQSSVNGSCNH